VQDEIRKWFQIIRIVVDFDEHECVNANFFDCHHFNYFIETRWDFDCLIRVQMFNKNAPHPVCTRSAEKIFQHCGQSLNLKINFVIHRTAHISIEKSSHRDRVFVNDFESEGEIPLVAQLEQLISNEHSEKRILEIGR
jgi:hypothetical protein